MSCLTRKLQQNLIRYFKRNSQVFATQAPESVREELVSKGICPSDVTTDQVRMMLKNVGC
jgi:hypothetical protein